MIGNLKDTTHKNQEQDWLKTNLAKFSGMMQGQRSIASVAQLIMSELTPLVDAQHGAFYMMDAEPRAAACTSSRRYGFGGRKSLANAYKLKESLIGQCAFEKKRILLTDVPDGLHLHRHGHGRGAAAQRRRPAGPLRGRDQGGHRAGVVPVRSRRTT